MRCLDHIGKAWQVEAGKRQKLELIVKCGRWQKPAETNDAYTLGERVESSQQLGLLRRGKAP